MEPTPTTTGALEVSVANELIHSKLSRGDGYVDSPEKIERILDAVGSGGVGERRPNASRRVERARGMGVTRSA